MDLSKFCCCFFQLIVFLKKQHIIFVLSYTTKHVRFVPLVLIFSCRTIIPNPFSTNAQLLYPLKTWENIRFPDVFSRYRSETLLENGLRIIDSQFLKSITTIIIFVNIIFAYIRTVMGACRHRLCSLESQRFFNYIYFLFRLLLGEI